jgi:hypothetical protein
MEVIGRRAILLLWLSGAACAGDQPQDVLRVINHVTTALADGDAASAMTVFDKSFKDYAILQGYFVALTSAYLISNEADVLDEEDTPTESKLTLRWSLKLTSTTSDVTSRRTNETTVQLAQKNGKWKIVDLQPIDLFDPQIKPASKQ